VAISLERGVECLHAVQLMPLYPKPHHLLPNLIRTGSDLPFLIPAYPGCPGKEAVTGVIINNSLCLRNDSDAQKYR